MIHIFKSAFSNADPSFLSFERRSLSFEDLTTKNKVFQFLPNFLWIGRRGKKLKKLEESISKFEFDLFHCEGKLFNRYYNFEVRFVCKFCKLPFHSSSSSLQRHNQGNVSNKSCEAQSQFNVSLTGLQDIFFVSLLVVCKTFLPKMVRYKGYNLVEKSSVSNCRNMQISAFLLCHGGIFQQNLEEGRGKPSSL